MYIMLKAGLILMLTGLIAIVLTILTMVIVDNMSMLFISVCILVSGIILIIIAVTADYFSCLLHNSTKTKSH